MKKLKTVFKVAAFYVALIALFETAGYVAIRYLESRAPSGIFAEEILNHQEPLLGFGLKKNLDQMVGYWRVKTNEWGFRSPSFPERKAPDEIRLFVVGGSTVFGWGVEELFSVPGYLQKIVDDTIRERYPKAKKKLRIVNAGVPWYASWHEASLIFFRIMELDPDWIVVLDGLNDTAASLSPTWSPLYRGFVDSPTRLAYEKRAASDKKPNWAKEILSISPTFRYFYARWMAREQTKEGVLHPAVWDQYVAYAERIKQIAESRGVRYSLYFQPVLGIDKEPNYFERTHNGTSMREPAFAEKFRDAYLAGEKRLLSHPTLAVTSLKSVFRDTDVTIYMDGLHYSNDGGMRLARALFDREIAPRLPQLLNAPSVTISQN